MASIMFDTKTVEDSKGFTPVPPGKYLVEIIGSEIKETKARTGEFILLTLRIVTGPHEGKRLFDRINFINQNKDAENIARRTLKRLCAACGILGELTDTEQLHYKRFHAQITIREDSGYGAQNVVRYPEVAASNSEQPQLLPARPAPTGAAKPWQKAPKF
jgi:hypothetical protein